MRSKLLGLAAALVLGSVSSAANAVSVYLLPEVGTAPPGGQFAVDMWWDFTGEATLGGGTDVSWDPAVLSFASLVFNSTPGLLDPAFTRCETGGNDPNCVSPGFLNAMATGSFNGLAGTGPLYIATITFDVVGGGGSSTAINLAEDGDIAGPFISLVTFDTYPNIEFRGASVSVVPLPAAAWLMIGGLGALLGFRRKA